MAFTKGSKKQDLRTLAIELGEEVTDDMRIIDLKELIENSDKCEEGFVRGLLEGIIDERKVEEEREEQRCKRKDELRAEELRLERAKLKAYNNVQSNQLESRDRLITPRFDIQKLIPKFDSKNDDISLYLALFERQAKLVQIPNEFLVAHLISLLPSDVTAVIAREPEEEVTDYGNVKKLLLDRFKLGPESFRQLMIRHQKKAEATWRDFYHEIKIYFEGWLDGLSITTFDELKDLMIVDQIKRRVPIEVKEHFVDIWSDIVKPMELTTKLDSYESVRQKHKVSPRQQRRSSPRKQESWEENKFRLDASKNRQGSWDGNGRNPRYSRPAIASDATKIKIICYRCGTEGHYAKNCTINSEERQWKIAETSQIFSRNSDAENKKDLEILTAKISVPTLSKDVHIDTLESLNISSGGKKFKGIIDSGAQISVIRSDMIEISDEESVGKIEIVSAFGEREIAPLRICWVKIDDGLHGEVPITCAISSKLVNDMLICRTAYDALNENVLLCERETGTRKCFGLTLGGDNAMGLMSDEVGGEDLKTSDDPEQNESKRTFVELQMQDLTLKEAWNWADNHQHNYEIGDGILMHSEVVCGEKVKQVVLPLCRRKRVLEMGHDIPLAGHLGAAKTKQRIKYSFFWPTIKKDVQDYCSSCKTCQLRKVVTYRDRIPIQPIVRPELPFEVWSVDCIGPLEPPSTRGHKFVICAVDMCSRWAEAIPVKNITAKTTCNVLMEIFTRTGFPKTICTDQGSNFTSELAEAFLTIIGATPRFATPGHPESMGVVERWNRTLKDMINKYIQGNGRDWDKHLSFLLFAYREVPHSTTGVSPYQMIYGRLPPGPLELVKNNWLGVQEIPLKASRTVEEYVKDLQNRIVRAHELASENSDKSQERYTNAYNLRSREKTFKVGDKVLILHPSSSHKLLKTWQGPAVVKELTRPHSVLVEMEDGSTRELHVNKVRPFFGRINQIGLVFDQDSEFGDLYYAPTDKRQSTIEDITRKISQMDSSINLEQKLELRELLCEYIDVFSDKPGHAKVEGHRIRVTADVAPKRLAPYRVPVALREEVDRQINELLELKLIEHSDSDWAHPIVCVAKKDGSMRLCVDYRALNSYTIADAYPMKIATELLLEVGKANFITILDLTKGYWQIPMEEESKPLTAFVTHSGHYQWTVLPFGLKNALSTFQRSLDKLLSPHQKYGRSYSDDVAVYSDAWKDHLVQLERILKAFLAAGLTINLKKCEFAKKQVRFLGHIVGSGRHAPDPQKIEDMARLDRPTTKKELRSILGLASYYRDYLPNFAAICLPLTNLTKKRVPNKIPWGEEEEVAFQKLKQELINIPSLYTPNPGKPYQLYTDASANAIGACLSQNDENGQEHPIAFYSKKLTPCQTRWSTIEREAYSVIAALKRFDTWIFGAQVEVVSDHNPLTFLTKGLPHGAKLARWSLALQRYNMTISYRKGNRHTNADALSRLPFKDE